MEANDSTNKIVIVKFNCEVKIINNLQLEEIKLQLKYSWKC